MHKKDDTIGRLDSEFETWESVDKSEEQKFHDQVIADAKMFLLKHKKAFEELAK